MQVQVLRKRERRIRKSCRFGEARGGGALLLKESIAWPVEPRVSTDAGLAPHLCREGEGAGTECLDLEYCEHGWSR